MGLFLLAAAILSLFHFSVTAYAAKDAAPKRVLIIYSYHEGLPWERLIDDSLRATLASKSTEPIELNVEHADRIRYPGDSYLKNFVDLLRHKYSQPKIDVVVGVDDEATDILLKYGDELFPGFRGSILRSPQVLELTDWKVNGKNGAAEILRLKRGTLRARMQKLGFGNRRRVYGFRAKQGMQRSASPCPKNGRSHLQKNYGGILAATKTQRHQD